MSFKDKVVLVTGGSSGIGAATAVQFAKEGASVAIVGRNEKKLKNVSDKCQKLGATVLVIKADISNEQEAGTIVQKTVDKFGKLDVLVNNAGMIDTTGLLSGQFLKMYDKVMSTNMRSVVQITESAVPHLVKTKGNIVNISSRSGTRVVPGMVAYCTSKAALNHFSRSVALELAASGVRVNIVSPGAVRTDILENSGSAGDWDDLGKYSPLGKCAESEEVSDLIVFLASDKAKSITGAEYVIDNGHMLN